MFQELIGKTKTQKLIDDISSEYRENLEKQFPKYFETNHTKFCCIVTALEKSEIKSIGINKLDDLLMDNWGKWFGGLISSTSVVNLRDQGNVSLNLTLFSGSSSSRYNNGTNGSVGTRIKSGSGITPATRQDFQMQSLLTSVSTSDGGYNSGLGKITISGVYVAGGNQSISEIGLFGVWSRNNSPFTPEEFLLSHDNISPVVSVLIGQTVNIDYELLLS